ncbi:phosphodiester glycosidase family protein, partial [Acetomicrobium mobile]|uniref:phosphodiester glycosidase family protein n=1 Tax=Acetomicrobium mobile TaxID=97477 RepID=UPI0026EAFFA9
DVSANEGFKPSFTDKRHPRTLWGCDGSKIYWVVVDGRDPWHSRGVTLAELTSLAKRLGMKDAVNLDGGGSSGLWWNGALVNHSPGGRERPLPYIIYIE